MINRKPLLNAITAVLCGLAIGLSAPLSAAPVISATKTDAIFNDVDNDGVANPGDTLKYTVTIQNSGDMDATNVQFDDTLDPNTVLVAGSITVAPIAAADNYSISGNTTLDSMFIKAANGLLANDVDPNGGGAAGGCTEAGVTCTATVETAVPTAQGGSVDINADGSFTYFPVPGNSTTDTFQYEITDAEGKTDTGTVSIMFPEIIWYVDNSQTTNGNGTSISPFNNLADAEANSGAGDMIYVLSGNGVNGQNSGITLKDGQSLIGQGVDLVVTFNGAPEVLFVASTPPVITHTAGTAVTLAQNNTLKGLNIGDGSNPVRGIGISGTNYGLLTVSDTNVTTSGPAAGNAGPALNLATGSLNATFASLSSTNSSGRGLAITGSSGTLNVNGTTSVSIPASEGLFLSNNTGTFNFSGLAITNTGNTGFSANNGGTVNVTGTANTISTGNGTALNFVNTTIGASGLTFQSISSSGGTNGILLNNTGTNGGFTVTGAGTAGSGGTIQNKATGISLTTARNVSLNRMQLNDFTDFAIRGSSVVNFTMDNTVINGVNGDNAAADEGSIRFTELTGSATISNCNISGGFEDNFKLRNTTGALNRITFTNATIGPNSTSDGNDGISLESTGVGTVLNVTVLNSFFTSARGDLFQLNVLGNSTADLIFTGNTLSNNHPSIGTGGGGVTISGGDNTGAGANLTSVIANNTFRDSLGHAILFVKSTDPGTFRATFDNNAIGVVGTANSGSLEGSGLKIQNAGLGAVTVAVTNNQIRHYNNFGIELLTGGGATALSGALNATVTGNTIANPGTNPATAGIAKNGLHLNAGTVPGDTYQICLDAGGAGALQNSLSTSGAPNDVPAGGEDIRLRHRQDTIVQLRGYTGTPSDNTAVQNYIIARNGGDGVPSAIASNQVSTATDGFVNTPGGGACPLP